MPAIQSKPETEKATERHLSIAQRKRMLTLLKVSTFFSIVQHTITIQTEPMLVKELCNNDAAKGTRALANTQGLVGILGLFLNQAGGKFSDAIGRKPFLLLGPLGNILLGALVVKNSSSPLLVLVCRVIRMVITTFSNTVIVGAALTDVVSGDDLAREYSKIGSVVGAGMIAAPIFENIALRRLGSLRGPYVVLSVLGALHATFNMLLMSETLVPQKRTSLSDINFSAFNPFGFLNIYFKGSRHLQKFVTIVSFQMFLEGKNLSDIGMTWMREHIKWNINKIRNYVVAYGALCIGTGTYLTPYLIKNTTTRGFTVLTDMLQAVSYILRGSSETAMMWLATVPLILPGVNANTALRLKSLAADHAKAEGFGKGEFSAWINNLRALSSSLSPVIYGNWYAMSQKRGLPAGTVYHVAAILGALLPEALLCLTSDVELKPPTQRSESLSPLDSAQSDKT
mmetsp:Transcript_112956/g.205758  ORF Transcript_112956/g.205758 Transcript_112956/m.205758 type:complete len:455 (-) Transcript_112956:130-1494(-)